MLQKPKNYEFNEIPHPMELFNIKSGDQVKTAENPKTEETHFKAAMIDFHL